MFEQALFQVCQGLSTSMQAFKRLATLVSATPQLKRHPEFMAITDFFEKQKENPALHALLKVLESSTFESDYSVLKHRGEIIRAYTLFGRVQKEFENLIAAVSNLDAYFSCARLYREHEHERVTYCFPEYCENQATVLSLQEVWHPMISRDTVVHNSLELGLEGNPLNIIVTGPNAGGKSVALKSFAFAAIMSQSLGIAPARSMVISPFGYIATYLNIVDDIGSGSSLFKAEVLRAHKLLIKIDRLQQEGRRCLTFFDEVFSGTNPLEGEAAAFSMAKLLGRYPNSMCCIATHFDLLTTLKAKTGHFENYKVVVDQTPEGLIKYTYQLKPGISEQHIAIDILASEGFDNEVIQDARRQVEELSHTHKDGS